MKQRTAAAEKTDARRKFGNFKKEEAKVIRMPKVKEDKTLAYLAERWKRFNEIIGYATTENMYSNPQLLVELASEVIRRRSISSKDIAKFCIFVNGLEEHGDKIWHYSNIGIFISGMTEQGQGRTYEIPAHLLDYSVALGCRNRKNLIVRGNAQDIGTKMEGGSITLYGNVYVVGSGLRGGKIIVNGNVARYDSPIGYKMTGGIIIVNGDTKKEVDYMRGGEVHLNGKWKGDREKVLVGLHNDAGKIYHNGELVFDK